MAVDSFTDIPQTGSFAMVLFLSSLVGVANAVQAGGVPMLQVLRGFDRAARLPLVVELPEHVRLRICGKIGEPTSRATKPCRSARAGERASERGRLAARQLPG